MFFDDFQAFISEKKSWFHKGHWYLSMGSFVLVGLLDAFLLSVIVLTALIGGDRWALLLAPGLK